MARLSLYGNDLIPITYIVNRMEQADIGSVSGHQRPPRKADMEATLARTPGRHLEAAIGEWLRATRRLARAGARAAWEALVSTSRAGLLLAGGGRPRRRL
jgi:hypothetical protein